MTGSHFCDAGKILKVINMTTLEEKKTLKRSRILESASKLFVDKSFASTAVDDVVKMAGVAKGTFYLYFKDKNDLLNQIVSYKSAEVLSEGISILSEKEKDTPMSLTEKGVFLADYIADYLSEHKDLAALLNKKLSSCFRSLAESGNEEFSGLINILTGELMKKGFTREQAEMKIYLVTDLIGSVCCDAVLGAGPYSLNQIRPEMKRAVSGILGGEIVD